MAENLWSVLALAALVAGSFTNADARKQGPDTRAAQSVLKITVVRADNGYPVTNAEMVARPVRGPVKFEALEMKTRADGEIVALVPTGTLLQLQVTAPGYQTYAANFQVNKPTVTVNVRLQPG